MPIKKEPEQIRQKIEWNKYATGETWCFIQGEDFPLGGALNLTAYAKVWAGRHGYKVTTATRHPKDRPTEVYLTFRKPQ